MKIIKSNKNGKFYGKHNDLIIILFFYYIFLNMIFIHLTMDATIE